MCCGHHRSLSRDSLAGPPSRRSLADHAATVEGLRYRLAETEARLARARAREAELSRKLEEMRRFVSVMEILENYLKRRNREQHGNAEPLLSAPSTS